MKKGFYTVLPDLDDPAPMHNMSDPLVRHLVNVYGKHIGANSRELPFVHGRYGEGLYGGGDPGRGMHTIPEIANSPGTGVVMIALDKVHAL